MTETAETTLGEIRKMVDTDPAEDPLMTHFVEGAAGYPDSTTVYISITGNFVTYALKESAPFECPNCKAGFPSLMDLVRHCNEKMMPLFRVRDRYGVREVNAAVRTLNDEELNA